MLAFATLHAVLEGNALTSCADRCHLCSFIQGHGCCADPNRCDRAFVGNTIGQANAVSDKVLDLRECVVAGKNLKGLTLSGALLVGADLCASLRSCLVILDHPRAPAVSAGGPATGPNCQFRGCGYGLFSCIDMLQDCCTWPPSHAFSLTCVMQHGQEQRPAARTYLVLSAGAARTCRRWS